MRVATFMVLLVWGCSAVPAAAQLQLADIVGVVLDRRGVAVPSATVSLNDPLGGVLRSQSVDAEGRFHFLGIAPGRYALRALIVGNEPIVFPLSIDSALPIEVTLRLPPHIVGTVTVEAPLGRDSVTSRNSVAGASVGHVPVRIGARGLQDLVATLPGWATDDNGLLHARGVDDGFLYVVDGVPVYERLDLLHGVGPDLMAIESVSVVTGYVPPEFGYKAGGVIDVRSRSAQADWRSAAQIDQAIDEGLGGGVSTGGRVGPSVTVQVAASGQRSTRFLDPVHPDNLHNRGKSGNLFAQLGWSSALDHVSGSLGASGAAYDVTNTEPQQSAGQDQRQRITQRFVSASWQRAWSSTIVSQVSAYARRAAARLEGSDADTPLTASADRTLARHGVIASVTRQRGAHLLKAGAEVQRLSLDEVFGFAVTDAERGAQAGFSAAAVGFTTDAPFHFEGRAVPTLGSLYAQDEWHGASALTVSLGVRADWTRLLLARHQWSPRLGAAYRLGDRTVLRASVSRFFQPPQPENILLASSEAARALSPFAANGGAGGAAIEPERQWAFEAGVERYLARRVRLDAAYWHRAVDQAADPNVFTGTTVIFPNAVARGYAEGVDLRLEWPQQGGWSAYAGGSVSQVRQFGPITGGLFLEDDLGSYGEGVRFVPDHDQRVVVSAGVNWEHIRTGALVGLTGRYESGTPIGREDAEDNLTGQPGAELVDFDRGRVAPRTLVSIIGDVPVWQSGQRSLSVRLSALNLFDRRYAYNFGNPFSGTHFGAPRTVSIGVRARF